MEVSSRLEHCIAYSAYAASAQVLFSSIPSDQTPLRAAAVAGIVLVGVALIVVPWQKWLESDVKAEDERRAAYLRLYGELDDLVVRFEELSFGAESTPDELVAIRRQLLRLSNRVQLYGYSPACSAFLDVTFAFVDHLDKLREHLSGGDQVGFKRTLRKCLEDLAEGNGKLVLGIAELYGGVPLRFMNRSD